MEQIDDIEEWKEIDGYDGKYRISNLGNVQTLKSYGYKLLKNNLGNNGYYYVILYDDVLKTKIHYVHQQVAKYFIGPKENGLYVLHGDGTRTNNNVNNLRYGQKEKIKQDNEDLKTLYIKKIDLEEVN